jgi:RecG-like helicase
MKKLFVNGDSNTAGADLNPNNISFDYDNAWPRWLSDHYNMSYENTAVSGAGNEMISRSTIVSLSEVIELDNVKPEDLFVIIQWSSFNRYEYWNYQYKRHHSTSLTSTYKPTDNVLKYVEYKTLLESKFYRNYKNLYYVYTTAKFLESYNIKYFFCNGLESFATIQEFDDCSEQEELKKEYKLLYNIYGKRKDFHLGFHNKNELFRQYLLNKNFPYSTLSYNIHFTVEGQKEYSNFLIEKINEFKILGN